jgi:hypothetical protein
MLAGISSRKEIASITPAANESMLNMKPSEGFFRIPINEPIIGPTIPRRITIYRESIINNYLSLGF